MENDPDQGIRGWGDEQSDMFIQKCPAQQFYLIIASPLELPHPVFHELDLFLFV
jgi:hypothetical protein